MSLRPLTISTLDKLYDVPWFIHAGVKDVEDALVAASWKEAVANSNSIRWDNIRIDAANGITVALMKRDMELFRQWNDRVAMVKPFSEALVAEKVAERATPEEFRDDVVKSARWDILHLCLECEFMPPLEPGFYSALAFYYVAGHFPCGVKGDPRTGRMIIY